VTPPRLEFAWRTDRGRVRRRNEDAVRVEPDAGLVVVADGIGGASAGDVASRMATEIIGEHFLRKTSLPDPPAARSLAAAAIEAANAAILDEARRDSALSGMGTTVVVGYFGDGWVAYAHVGDSRLYRLRDRQLQPLTTDHSFIEEVVERGFFPSRDEARRYGISENVLTRALGSAPDLDVPTAVAEVLAGDLYLFCTDGLSGMVPDDDLRSLLSAADADLDATADALVRRACDNGGSDNITLAVVRSNDGDRHR
jgi:serine/threonine protein phosphatase PrpC